MVASAMIIIATGIVILLLLGFAVRCVRTLGNFPLTTGKDVLVEIEITRWLRLKFEARQPGGG